MAMAGRVLIAILFAFLGPQGALAQLASEEELKMLLRKLTSANQVDRNAAADRLEDKLAGISPVEWFEGTHEARRKYSDITKPFLPKLVSLLGQKEERVSRVALGLLGLAGVTAYQAERPIRDVALDDNRDNSTRWEAISALCFVTPDGQPVLPQLCPVLEALPEIVAGFRAEFSEPEPSDPPNAVSSGLAFGSLRLVHALYLSGHTTADTLWMVDAAMSTRSEETQVLLLLTVAQLGALTRDVRPSVDSIWPMLYSENPTVRYAAGTAIISTSRDYHLLPQVVARLASSERKRHELETQFGRDLYRRTRERQMLIRAMRHDPGSYLPRLTYDVLHGRAAVRRNAIRDLAAIGSPDDKVMQALRHALKSTDRDTRELAQDAIERTNNSQEQKIAPNTNASDRSDGGKRGQR